MPCAARLCGRLAALPPPLPLRRRSRLRLSTAPPLRLGAAPLPPPPPAAAGEWREGALSGLPPAVAAAARALTAELSAAGTPCAIVGAVACNAYGHRRATADVDVLVNARDADAVRATLVGRGWAARFPGARKMLRDKVRGVDVDVLLSGDFPGDGLPKRVSFPELSPTSEDVVAIDGARIIPLPRLIELKLASGTSAPGSRRKDLADVYALIAANRLPREYALEVDCSVREAYCKIWDDWQESHKSGLDP